MNKGYVNWKLVLVLALGVLAVGATVVGVRKFNRTQRAEQGLKLGLKAYDEKRWKDAAVHLGQYLSVHQSDAEILAKYGAAQSRIQPPKREHYAAAVNAYRAVLRNDPAHRQAALALTELYMDGQAYGEAESTASRYLEGQFDSQIAHRLAAAQLMQRKYEPAAALLLDLVQREPNVPDAYELLARLAQQNPQLAQKSPQEWLDIAVQNAPDNAQTYLICANYYLRDGRRTEAMDALEKAGRCTIADPQVRLAIAAAFLRLQASDAAGAQLDAAFALEPDAPLLWQLRAMLAAQRNDPAAALRTAQEGIAHLGVNDLVFLPFAVELFMLADDVPAAKAALERLRKAEFNPGMAFYLDGLLAERGGDWSKAMTCWRQAVEQGYTEEAVYLKLAEGAMRLEDRATAIETLRRYISRAPQSLAAQLAMAQILVEGRQWKEASEYAAAAVRLDSANAQAQQLQTRCRIELMTGHPQSQERIDQMVDELIAADDTPANRLVAFRVALSRQDWPKAEAMLTEMGSKFGDSVTLRLARAEFWSRQGNAPQAAQTLDEAIAQFPDASEPVIVRASLLADGKDAPTALTLLTAAAERLGGAEQRRILLFKAEILQRSGQSDQAVKVLSQMAQDNPQDIMVRRQLLAIGRETLKTEQLDPWIEQIKQIEGQAGRLWRIEQVANWLMEEDFQKRYSEAASLLNDNLKVNPDDKQSLMLLAAAHERAGNLRLAVSLYREALMRHPEDMDLAVATIGVLYRAEEYRQADQLLNELLSAGHTDPRLAQMELQSHLRQGRLDSAEAMLEKMVAGGADNRSAKLSLAMLKSRSGQFEDARRLIDALIAEDPASVAPQAALTDWFLRQARREDAIAVCNAYLAAHEGVDAYRLRAQVLLAIGQPQEAKKDIEHILSIAGSDAESLLSVSELYRIADDLDNAVAAAQKALAIAPSSFEVQKMAALLLMERPQTQQEGLKLLDQALAQQPRDPQLRLRRGTWLLEDGSGAAALEGLSVLNALISEYPRQETAWITLGQWYLFSNQPGMAMDTALRGLSSLPDSRALLLLKARVEAMRSPAIALETLTPLVRRYPDDAALVEMQARLLHQTGKTDQAMDALRQWVAVAKQVPIETAAVELTLMELLYQSGDAEQAGQLYASLQARPEQSMTAMLRWMGLSVKTADADQITAIFEQWYNAHPQEGGVAAMSAVQGLLSENTAHAMPAAQRILELVVGREPNSAEAVYGLALVKHITGQTDASIGLYERTLELRGDNVLAMNNLAWILSQKKGDHQRALQLAEKGLAIAPNYTDLIDTYANVLYALGQFDKAAEQFGRAVDRYTEVQPEKTAAQFGLAQALDKAGKKDVAKVEFFKARDLDQKIGGLTDQQKIALEDQLK